MEDYNDFLAYLNDGLVKVKEMIEKVTILHNETAIALLEASTLYNPQILLDLAEIAVNGRKFDKYILEGQEIKIELENMAIKPQSTTEEFEEIKKELILLEESLNNKK